jgi:hypothetical protein
MDNDFPDDVEQADIDEDRAVDDEDERHSKCWCGAWQFSKASGSYVCVADCVCGND